METTLGIDIGNGTAKAVILDKDRQVLTSAYLKNNGIIETLKTCFANGNGFEKHEVIGVGVTGAGRSLTKHLTGADIIMTEIVCHAIGALNYTPNVKTILEIGANDNKMIFLEDGLITAFSTQSLCASGTGNFLETIGNRLGIRIEDFADCALQSKSPCNISSKCTVFAMSNCVSLLNLGYKKEDILMGVAQALIRNNIALLAKGKKLKAPFVFQGGVSKNRAVIKVLEEYLDDTVVVPEHSPLMGAIGAATLVWEKPPEKTKFKGFDFKALKYSTGYFVCKGCENNCEVTTIKQKGEIIGYIGDLCGKWEEEEEK